MPIAAYLANHAFDQAQIEDMSMAFVAVCRKLRLVDRSDKANAAVAKTIIELAQSGVRDADILRRMTLREFNVLEDVSEGPTDSLASPRSPLETTISSELKQNAFIAALAEPERALVAKQLSPFVLNAGQRLHKAGDTDADVIFPHSGAIVLMMRRPGDGAVGVALVGRDGFVGGVEASASALVGCDAEVHISGRASRIAAKTFRNLVDRNPNMRRLAAHFDAVMITEARQIAYCNTVHPVEARICRWLAEILDRSDEDWIPLNQATLAEVLSVRRTTVTVVIGRLENAGVLRWRRGYVDILDRGELVRRSCGCHADMRRYGERLFAVRDLQSTATQSAAK